MWPCRALGRALGRVLGRALGRALGRVLVGIVAKLARCSPVCVGISRQAALKKFPDGLNCSNGAVFPQAIKINGVKVSQPAVAWDKMRFQNW
jgi:hypothetical protein